MKRKAMIKKLINKGGASAFLIENGDLHDWIEFEDRKEFVFYSFGTCGVTSYLSDTPSGAEANPNSTDFNEWDLYDTEKIKYFLEL